VARYANRARVLRDRGKGTSTPIALMQKAQAIGVLAAGDPAVPAGQFFYLLTSDLLLRLVLGVAKAPGAHEIGRRVEAAVDAVLRLHAR
jgi:hypothetical protein